MVLDYAKDERAPPKSAPTSTPGPWSIEGRRGAGYIISAGVNRYGDGPDSYVGVLDPMFYVAGEPSPLAENARLITAAPDLLAMLINLVELCDDVLVKPAECDDLIAAKAAIAKATGQ